ncbi:MAG: hypothetical protein COT24_00575 [Candidatus Kerfeldbacteria bacterium CG08_land_8_20_14_0_20_40_16]|uniref:TIGR04086 family membrane protein n=1 Tax=Candidatus Kerfeldbacteria bacterium CG08_land_8_20_14_0_20_40_16 TaxID=2014244 RepID=A0A2H0YXJ9_9BACT|nr:MAG: hypothetical protein COT24_00575 [Candidatus Kerfeldbacteria bacterium CG08_land_8_20_14_0_20_40_16]
MTNVKTSLKMAGYGLLLFISTGVVELLIAVVTGSYESIDYWWANLIKAAVVAFFSWLFSRLLHPNTTKQAFTHGIVWAVILVFINLILAIPNGFNYIFGHWSVYLVFIGAGVGPLFGKKVGLKNTGQKPDQ